MGYFLWDRRLAFIQDLNFILTAYEYVPDSEAATSLATGLSISEEDLLDKDVMEKIEEFSAPCFILPLGDSDTLEEGKPKK